MNATKKTHLFPHVNVATFALLAIYPLLHRDPFLRLLREHFWGHARARSLTKTWWGWHPRWLGRHSWWWGRHARGWTRKPSAHRCRQRRRDKPTSSKGLLTYLERAEDARQRYSGQSEREVKTEGNELTTDESGGVASWTRIRPRHTN